MKFLITLEIEATDIGEADDFACGIADDNEAIVVAVAPADATED